MEEEETIIKKECEKIRLLDKLAAFIDGEGSIIIHKKKHPLGYHYQQTLHVTNTDTRLIQWLVDNFGGKFPKAIKMGGDRKDAYRWQLTGSNSYNLLKKICPYLILKQEQANNVIELYEKVSKWNHGGNKPMPEHKRKLVEELYHRNKELNKRGKINNEEEVEVPVTIKIRKDVLDEWIKEEDR